GATDPRVKDLAGNALAANVTWTFTTSAAADTTPPTVTSTTPVSDATGVSPASPVTAVFSEAMNAATITGSTFELRDPGNALVPATVGYNASTNTATLTPTSPLASSASYTATVRGGATDPRVKDLAGNALAANVTWSFTTSAAADTTPPAVPSNVSATASASGVVVSWSANTDPDLAGYHVYRRAGGTGAFTRLNASLLTSPTFDDTLAPSGTSDYTVTAADTSGNESAQAPPVSATMAKANRVLNPGFEIDANTDTRPDSWSADSRFTRSFATARSGTYSGRHFATTNAGYTITQVVTGLSAGTTYTVAGWVNIPPTSDAFTFTVRVRWRNSSNSVIRTDTVKAYTAATAGWDKALASLVAPSGTTNAQVQMVVSSLNAAVHVDDFALR
ncbi:MAG: Ig-like domain-containing protein, partial [bacterium]